MSSLDITQLNQILNNDLNIKYKIGSFDYFVETGTHMGQTVIALSPYFKYIKTIEISKLFYHRAESLIKSYNIINIEQILGDSAKELENITIKIDKDIIYFLDGHYSSGETGKGDKDVPLLEELEMISKRNKNDIIIIDDYRLFGTSSNEDWSQITVNSILSIFNPKQIVTYFNLNDRFCMFLKNP